MTSERWARFPVSQQLLMIGNEMNRGRGRCRAGDLAGTRRCYERVLALCDLTVETRPRRGLRRELLRWRDLVATLFVSACLEPEEHDRTFRALLLLSPAGYQQLPHLLGPR